MVDLKGNEKAKYVARMFDQISGHYDLLNNVMSGGMHHSWRKQATKLAVEGDEGEALDIATGTGDFAFSLAQRPEISRVTGLDFAPQMLPLARNKARDRGLSEVTNWLLGDALFLPFPDNHFKCVTVGFGLRNFSDVITALSEMTRVIRPGGRIVILDILPHSKSSLLRRLFKLYFRGVVPLMGALLARNRSAYTYLPESVESFLTAQDLVAAMEEVGLQNVRYKTMSLGTVAIHIGEKLRV